MATQTLAQADAILKDYYVGPIVEQLNQDTYLLDQIERDSDHLESQGRRAVVPVHKNRNRGRGSIADGGNLPAAGFQQALDAIIPIKYHTYGIELSDGVIQGTQTDAGAFVSALQWETQGVATDMRKDMNRQVYGVGTGLLGNVTSASSQTFTMTAVADMQYIQIGDTIDVVVKSSGATSFGGVGLVVTARNVAAKTVTVTGTITTAGSVDTTFGAYVAGNWGNEMDGLRNMSATASRTLHSINSATAGNEFWNPQVTALTGVASESSFETLFDQIQAVGNGKVEAALTTLGIRRRLADQYQSQKRFQDAQATTVHGGFTAIWVNDVPVMADVDCPKGYAFAFNKSAYKWFEQAAPGWLELEGSGVFHLKVAAAGQFSSNWQAFFRWYAAFACVAPNRTGALTSCTDDNPV